MPDAFPAQPAAGAGHALPPIPGTTLFDGDAAARGFALNAMCYSFNEAANRAAFLADEDAYCARFGLTAPQRKAIADRDVLGMIAAGGNIYYLAKLAGIFHLNVQDVGAMQTGQSVEAFKAMLQAQASGQTYEQAVEGSFAHG
ncbi:MAG TPA: protocatechuate 4,5-dioxygenase subunit alpha [Novosphingobium sp.]|nr:protocatechuate 4,5-dioxygenase subunit alpha [Novosphingobium sp.]HZV08810.1 protocatechuate 4,5-dioxygenase subunit alpha [Novosphingobium sp.]